MFSSSDSARLVLIGIVVGVLHTAAAGDATAQGLWSPPMSVADGGRPDVAMDASGNALAIWVEGSAPITVIRAARFSAATHSWSTAVDLSAPGVSAGDPHLAVNALGNAVAIWRTDGAVSLVQVAHYSATAGTWSAGATLSSLEQPAGLPTVGLDGEGNAFAAWRRLSDGVVQAARYCVQFGFWDPSPDVSAPGRQPETAPVIAVETGGGAVLAWGHWASTGGVVVQAARWTVSTGTWSPSMTLSTSRVDAGAFYPAVAVDGSGNATVGWELHAAGQFATVETARFSATTGTWGASVDLSGPGTRSADRVQVAMDGSGNAIAIWTRNDILQTARYSSSTATWSAPHDLSGPAGNRVVQYPKIAITSGGDAVAAWQRYLGGPRGYAVQASFYSASATAWTGIVDLDPSAFNAVAVNIAMTNAGAAMAVWVSGQLSDVTVRAAYAHVPATPSLLPAAVTRPDVTLSWIAPATGPAPTDYTLVASLSPDGTAIATQPLGVRTSVQVQAPDGTYYVRVVATVAGTTVPSNEIVVVVGPTPVPTAPLALGVTVTGNTFVMAWTAPANAAVAPVATYVIEAGTTTGATNLANFATGGAATSFLTPPVPNGSYYVRVRARNASGTGPPTSDLRVVVGPPPPGPPVLTSSVAGDRTVFLAWTAPLTGAAVTGYQLQAGTAPGLSNAGVLLLPSAPLDFVAPGVPAGTYFVRVVATSALGLGFVSNEVAIVVP